MKSPLIVLTACYIVSFLDGFFEWYLPDGFYGFLGLVMLGALAWMWIIELKGGKEGV